MIIPPVLITTITGALASLVPKALSDLYDYVFNDEIIQVRKKADKTELTIAQQHTARIEYGGYIDKRDMTQQELTDKLNIMFGTSKSLAQMMRICRST